ncbi:MAG: type IV secretion system protein [Acidobacteriaceae bacterium]|nr:type IV secretion system protein [Acidobacteriaceae bacterium]
MWLGAFYALLLYGRQWIPAIIDSFSQLGGTTAGINGNQGLSPSDVFTQGLIIAAALMDAASSSAFFTNPGTGLAVMLAAALVVIAFIAVTIQFPFGLVTASALWASNVAARSQRSRTARSENGSEVSMPRRTDLTGRIRTVGLVARFVAGSAIGLTLVADKVLSRAVESATRSARMFLLAVAGVLCVGNLALVNAHRKGRGA